MPSDDEELAGHRSCSHTSSNTSQPNQEGAKRLEPIPSPASTAASTWRAFRRPRMALAVLAVSLQHIAAHSSHHHNQASSQNSCPATPQVTGVVQQEANRETPAPTSSDARTSSLDEGIEPDR